MSYKIITISREFGSGGRFIGEETAKKLGIAFYDREIIAKVADDLGLSEKYVADRGEYAPSKNIFSYAFIGRDINGNSIADQIYSYQQKIIKELAAKEPCVIVGRSADYILSGRDDVLNVFIQGNKADKIVRIKEIYSKSDDEAAKMIKDTDKKRSVNYRYCTDQEWGSRKNYDIVLNSSTLGYDNCIDVISKLYR
ncbi:MAG: AAA family ATPase [Agathobacter sp.]|jgi:cytidylate kinase|uniref:cytidylate kinase-like family protein n=1 Tax=Agathobacter sp. TaxID=2021311 RepID=UPI003993B6EC